MTYNLIKKIYRKYKKLNKLNSRYVFENRKKDYQKLCIILAGHKPYLYDAVFGRIIKFIPKDIEVCIVSSGIYDNELSEIAKENEWSYLSIKRNSVTLIQNIAINLFEKAEYIYKLDEDIFITKGYFETLLNTYHNCNEKGEYQVGFVAPTIPINGFGYMNILKRFNMIETYTKKFEKPIYAAGKDRKIESDPEVAKFMWGNGEYIPQIDEMNKIMQEDEFTYNVCPIKFSIGAILFSRKLWQEMEMFNVVEGIGMGVDEQQLCSYCIRNSKVIIVSNNSIVGHLGFENQNKEMKEYFIANKEKFYLK